MAAGNGAGRHCPCCHHRHLAVGHFWAPHRLCCSTAAASPACHSSASQFHAAHSSAVVAPCSRQSVTNTNRKRSAALSASHPRPADAAHAHRPGPGTAAV